MYPFLFKSGFGFGGFNGGSKDLNLMGPCAFQDGLCLMNCPTPFETMSFHDFVCVVMLVDGIVFEFSFT